MEGKANILFLGLLVALLSQFSTGRLSRIDTRDSPRCRTQIIPMLPTTKKPKQGLPPTTEATTRRPVEVFNPVMLHSSGFPYCKSRDVNEILRPAGRRRKRAVSWPYECRHASILHFSGKFQLILPIYDCCSKCSFPAFAKCVAKSKSKKSPEWLCPSEGLQCIVGCVNKHKPGSTIGDGLIKPDVIQPGVKPIPNPDGEEQGQVKPVLSSCEKFDEENGKQCIRRLCIPLNFN